MTFSLTHTDRVALVGDSHANYLWTLRVLRVIAGWGVSHVIFLGDFGYWPAMALGREFIDGVASETQRLGLSLAFLDGNHEDHAALRTAARGLDDADVVELVPGINHLRRGARLQFGSHTVVACGGAVSVDRQRRVAGVDWFAEEVLDEDTVARIVGRGPAQLVLTHDAPLGARCHTAPGVDGGLAVPTHRPGIDAQLSADVLAHQQRVARLLEGLEASTVVHGHYHYRYTDSVDLNRGPVRVEGLGRDGAWPGDGFVVMDADLRLVPIEDLEDG